MSLLHGNKKSITSFSRSRPRIVNTYKSRRKRNREPDIKNFSSTQSNIERNIDICDPLDEYKRPTKRTTVIITLM